MDDGRLTLTLRRRADIAAPEPGWAPIAWAVGPAADALVLFVRERDQPLALGRDRGIFPISRLPHSIDALVVRHDGRQRATAHVLTGLAVGFPHVQPLSDGAIVVCGARCARFRSGEVERNAQVFDRQGALQGR